MWLSLGFKHLSKAQSLASQLKGDAASDSWSFQLLSWLGIPSSQCFMYDLCHGEFCPIQVLHPPFPIYFRHCCPSVKTLLCTGNSPTKDFPLFHCIYSFCLPSTPFLRSNQTEALLIFSKPYKVPPLRLCLCCHLHEMPFHFSYSYSSFCQEKHTD